MDYWRWLLIGVDDRRPGWRRFLNRWLLLHGAVGLVLAWLVPVSLKDAAVSALLPLAGLFVGLCFAWGGNAQALLQTDEIERMAKHHPGGVREYVYVYQTAILVVMTALSFWGLAGLEVFDQTWPTSERSEAYFCVEVGLFFATSATLRECWHVVLGAQHLLLKRAQIRKHDQSRTEEK